MGVYYTNYLGGFLKIPNSHEPVTETYFKKPSGKRAKTRFNPETGIEHEKVTTTSIKKVYASAYIEDRDDLDEDMFWQPAYAGESDDYIVAIPNRTGSNLLKRGDDDDVFNHSLQGLDYNDEITKFKNKYKSYIKYFVEKYGNVEVDFGIIRYGH